VKVLIIGTELSPPFTSMEAKMVDYLVASASENGAEIELISIELSDGKHRRADICQVNGTKKGIPLYRKLVYGVELLRVVRNKLKAGVDVLHLIWVGVSPIITILRHWARQTETKIIVTILNKHAPASRYADLDGYVFHSPSTQGKFVKGGIPQSKTHLILPPVNCVASFKVTAAEPYFVFASGPRTSEQIVERGVHLLFEAFSKLNKDGVKVGLRFFGRWPAGASELVALKEDYGAHNVTIYNSHRTDLLDQIASSSGVIVPYVGGKIGDVPLAALESLALGRPVISTRGLGLDDYLEGSLAGVLINPDVSELYHAVSRLSKDTESRKDSALELAKSFHYKTFVADSFSLYRRISHS